MKGAAFYHLDIEGGVENVSLGCIFACLKEARAVSLGCIFVYWKGVKAIFLPVGKKAIPLGCTSTCWNEGKDVSLDCIFACWKVGKDVSLDCHFACWKGRNIFADTCFCYILGGIFFLITFYLCFNC